MYYMYPGWIYTHKRSVHFIFMKNAWITKKESDMSYSNEMHDS